MLDLVTIGRISVDLYGQEIGKGLSDPQTFRKAVGGSPTNVAIGVARYGHKSAVVTGVGILLVYRMEALAILWM